MSTDFLHSVAIAAIKRFSPSIHQLPDNRDCTAFFFDHNGETVFNVSCDDAYIALAMISLEAFPVHAIGIGLVSPGWMSPSGNTAPSSHPERQRVELATVLNLKFDSGSAVWNVHAQALLENEDGASGPLLDALGHALFRSVATGASGSR